MKNENSSTCEEEIMKKIGLSVTSLGLATLVTMAACQNDRNEFVKNIFVRSQVFASTETNAGKSSGLVEQLDTRALQRQFSPDIGVRGKIALNGAGDLFGVATDGGLRVTTNQFNRNSGQTNSRDSAATGPGIGFPAGFALVDARSLVIACDSNTMTVFGFGQKVRSGGTAAFVTNPLAATPNDVAYDASNDRLYVALTNGTVVVFDTFLAGTPNNATPDVTITVTFGGSASINITSLTLVGDRLFLTDAGATSTTDGAIGVINGVTAATATTGTVDTSAAIAGTNTGLVDPSSLAIVTTPNDSSSGVFVADPGADRIYSFGSALNGFGGNVNPTLSITSNNPRGLFGRVGEAQPVVDANDNDTAASTFSLVITNNAGNVGNTLQILKSDLTIFGDTFTIDGDLGGPPSVENCVVDSQGNIFVTANDTTTNAGDGGIYALSRPFGNTRLSVSGSRLTSGTDQDSVLTGNSNVPFRSPKGFDVCRDAGVIITVDNDVAAPAIVVYGINASGDSSPVGSTLNLGSIGRRPWDCDYDQPNDRLFVACTDGTCIVYDNFLATKLTANGTNAPSPDRVITPSSGLAAVSVNLHGVVYVPGSDQLVLSDVGAITSGAGAGDDGQIFVINNASSADGQSTVSAIIGGAATMLGNPVDIVNNGSTLFVAEKANGMILRFDNILNRGDNSGNVAPDAMIAASAPESVSILRGVETVAQIP
jgi:hypothetical protein